MKTLNQSFATVGLALTLMTTLSSITAFAGADGSGGGIGIRVNGQIQVLDLAEAQSIQMSQLPEYARLKAILAEMRAYNEGLASAIQNAIEQKGLFFYFTRFEILPTSDSRSLVDVQDVQMAAQRGNLVVISESLWNEAAPDQRVALLLHETLQNLNPSQDRLMLRRVVDRIMSQDFGSDEEFTRFLFSMNLRYSAGATPACKAAFDRSGAHVQASEKAWGSWVAVRKPGSDLCLKEKDARTQSLANELTMQMPPSYCRPTDLSLLLLKNQVAQQNLKMAQSCLLIAIGK